MTPLLVVAALAAAGLAGEPPVPTFSSDTALVNVTVSVASKKSGKPVENLSAADFRIYENGVLQQLSVFERQELPIDLMLMIDTSLSMGIVYPEQQTRGQEMWGELAPDVKEAAKEMIAALRSQDRAAIISFANGAYMAQESVEIGGFSSNHQFLNDTIDSLFTKGNTRLYLALYTTLRDYLPKYDPAHPRRTIIVLLTDGEDTGSVIVDEHQLRVQARKTAVAIYPIELPHASASRPEFRQMADEAHSFLTKLAEETGGFIQTLGDRYKVREACKQITSELGVQYRLGYQPTDTKKDGTWRQLVVAVTGRTDLNIRHRAGYFAEKN